MESVKHQCPICLLNGQVQEDADGEEIFLIKCLRCGSYRISKEVCKVLNTVTFKSYVLSGFIRTSNLQEEIPSLDLDLIQEVDQNFSLLTLEQKEKNLIAYMGMKAELGEACEINSLFDYPLIFAREKAELNWLISEMIKEGVLDRREKPKSMFPISKGTVTNEVHKVTLTKKGFEKMNAFKALSTSGSMTETSVKTSRQKRKVFKLLTRICGLIVA
ncbi:MAG: hypothetical protein C4520_10335 [Candidatus Abyssobacteria bacterium SURF_5]|uniref:Uncharacterized protein n=1 Tax=Abyssobacteria bacterium (strain SURF_5) TaxID=2093360 RepID=A0A3A4NVI0_ABYX5|nr:MAG: hypothetical protein C4520_10335 [Candidatus Abyssubacteria bacterium SURF_5]